MKITRVETILLRIPLRRSHKMSFGSADAVDFVIPRVYTDEDIVGVGESATVGPLWAGECSQTIHPIIESFLGPAIIGQDPMNIEAVLNRMDEAVKENWFAKAAVEFALFDIAGKKLKVPAYQLLGGLCQERIQLSWSLASLDVDVERKEAKGKLDEGFRIFKLKVGALSPDKDVERVKAIRDEFGYDIGLRVDANQGWNVNMAIKVIRKMERYELDFVEQPVRRSELANMAKIAKAVDVPIMADESLDTMQDAIDLVREEAADVFGLKPAKSGGMLKCKKIAGIAEAAGIPCYVGCMIETGIGTAAYAHVGCSSNAVTYGCELWGPLLLEDDISKEPVKFSDGYIYVPKGSGLGVEIDEAKLKKYM